MHKITLFVKNGVWIAKHTDPEVVRLFGTDELPTPYTAGIPPHAVESEIQALNPDREVVVDPEPHINELREDNPQM